MKEKLKKMKKRATLLAVLVQHRAIGGKIYIYLLLY